MALIGFVYLRAPGSTLEIAKILSFTIIPVFLIGPIAGERRIDTDIRMPYFGSEGIRGLQSNFSMYVKFIKSMWWKLRNAENTTKKKRIVRAFMKNMCKD